MPGTADYKTSPSDASSVSSTLMPLPLTRVTPAYLSFSVGIGYYTCLLEALGEDTGGVGERKLKGRRDAIIF